MKMRSLEITLSIYKITVNFVFYIQVYIHLQVLPFVTFTADNSSTTCLFLMLFVDVFRETTPVRV